MNRMNAIAGILIVIALFELPAGVQAQEDDGLVVIDLWGKRA